MTLSGITPNLNAAGTPGATLAWLDGRDNVIVTDGRPRDRIPDLALQIGIKPVTSKKVPSQELATGTDAVCGDLLLFLWFSLFFLGAPARLRHRIWGS